MQGSRDPAVAIPRAVNGALNAAKASAKAGLKRFVFTSSSFAVTQPKPGKVFTLTSESFNDEAVERVKTPGADGATVYSASKVEAERALSRWVEESQTSLVVNTGMSSTTTSKQCPNLTVWQFNQMPTSAR